MIVELDRGLFRFDNDYGQRLAAEVVLHTGMLSYSRLNQVRSGEVAIRAAFLDQQSSITVPLSQAMKGRSLSL